MSTQTDVAIIGGGPAGAATAIALTRAGLRLPTLPGSLVIGGHWLCITTTVSNSFRHRFTARLEAASRSVYSSHYVPKGSPLRRN
jgi:cation diffusion facilitator CzcD-associated flavoprotein CzcO